MKKVDTKDIMALKFLSSLGASSDGSKIGFVVQKSNEEGSGYEGHIYLYDRATDRTRRLTGLGEEKGFCWLDETTILFPANRDKKLQEKVKNGELWTVYYTLDITGGEASEYMRIPRRVTDITPLGGGKFVMSAAYIPDYPDLEKLSPAEKAEALKKLREEKEYEVAEEIPFWSNGTIGFTAGMRSRLYTYDKNSGEAVAITGEKEQLGGYSVKDGKVLFITTLHEDKIGQQSGLYLHDLASGKRETLIPQRDYKVVAAEFVGDTIMAAASDMKTYGNGEHPNLYVCEAGGMKLVLESDESLTNSVASDVKLGKYKASRSCEKYLYFVVTRGYSSYITRVNAAGNVESFGRDEGAFFDFIPVKDGFVAIAQRGDCPQELWFVGADGTERRLTDFNEDYFNTHSVVTPEHFTFESNGTALDGWVMLPPDCDKTKKYPAIFNIHGGPKTAYGSVFMHEMQVWANAGYVVFYTNPHGGSGRGDAFADIRGKYGTIDYEDLMTFTDEVIKRYACIDADKIGVTGGSYGGFMTNWIIGHTDRFAAAATQRSICNWVSFAGTTDIGYFFGQDQMATNPWDDVEKLWWHSPLKYADNFKTPTLVVHSDQDLRCWLVEGLQMFTALKYHGVESRLWVCHSENHELSRGGKPKNRVRRLEEITGWFDTYLK